MKQGGTRSTTWKKGQTPIKKKGTKHRRTRLKEAIGLKDWNGLMEFIKKDGATKMINEMAKLRGKDYRSAYISLCEYVMPKLSRVDWKPDTVSRSEVILTREEIKRLAQILEEEC